MKVEFDPEAVRMYMDLWRSSLDMKIPLARDVRVHFFARRGELLDGFFKHARSWLMLIHMMKADGEDRLALDRLEGDVEAFKQWAEEGITELAKLGAEELQKDGRPGVGGVG